nr:putative reverse transcriptase domain-containing protein [Tanacetum cinerariifolium]
MKKDVCDEFELNAARLSKFLLSGKSVVKRSGDVTRLQAQVDKKRIVIFEEVVREILQLNDAEGVVCLPNEEIFAGLARMGYEKPSTKLTFYKAFFSTQWKFFIHTILHSLSAKRTSWNEFSSAMASALIYVVPPTPTSPSPSSPVIPSSPPHQSPCPPQPQATEGSSHVFQQVCKPYLDKFMIVFIDDIMIYSKSNQEHEEHLELILKFLKKEELYAKFSKCDFWIPKVQFLGHVIDSQEGVEHETPSLAGIAQ